MLVMAYVQSLYRRRAPNTTVRGATSTVRALEDRMAKYSLPREDDDRRTFGGPETLQLISQGCKDRVDWSAVLSFVGVQRVGETISVRRRGLGNDAMCFGGSGLKNMD